MTRDKVFEDPAPFSEGLSWSGQGHAARRRKGVRVGEKWRQRWPGESSRGTDGAGKSWDEHGRQRKGEALKGKPEQVGTRRAGGETIAGG